MSDPYPSAEEWRAVGADLRSGNREDVEAAIRTIIKYISPRVRYLFQRKYPRLSPFLDDIIAETVFRIWNHRMELDPYQSIQSWFFRIAHNYACDLLRKTVNEVCCEMSMDVQVGTAPYSRSAVCLSGQGFVSS